jgi:hypothetical protein
VNNIIMLCLPSHLTHLLLPNDSGFNKAFKHNFDQLGILSHIEGNIPINLTEISRACVKALEQPNIPKAIINSYAHCGLWPLDPLKGIKLIASEKSPESDPTTLEVAKLTMEHIDNIGLLKSQQKKRSEDTPSVKKRKFSTAKARVLTTPQSIAELEEDNHWSQIKKMKVNPLRTYMQETLRINEDSMKENGKWMTKPQLLTLAEAHLSKRFEQREKEISDHVNLFCCPPLPCL